MGRLLTKRSDALGVLRIEHRQRKDANTRRYRILIEQDEDGVFVAECPVLPGCVSQGKTRQEALDNIQDAIQGYLERLRKHREPIPFR